MKNKKHAAMLLLSTFLIVTSGYVFAQDTVLRIAPYSEVKESLFAQIEADTTSEGEWPAVEGRIYELDGGGIYINQDIFYVEAGKTLHIRSNNGAKAVIYQFPTGTGDNPQNPPGYFARSRGGDIILENLAISGYDETSDDPENGKFDQLYTVQGNFLRTDSEGASIILKGNIFSNISGQVLRTNASTEKIHIEDNIFANLGALSTSNFGAGKGIDLRESTTDSLIMINNTFVNYQDRIIRHYNFGNPLEGTGDILYGRIEHNTFVNGMGFHGVLSLGNVGPNIIIKNNLFVDAFAGGEDSTDVTRTAEWANTGASYGNGNPKMSWIFAAPNDTTTWTISNNYYALSEEGLNFINSYDTVGIGSPLSDYIKSALGDDAASAFSMIDDPGLTNIPELMIGMLTYYREIANRTKDTPNDVWDPAQHDFDRKPITYFVNDFDASYATSSEAYTGSDLGLPVGDLNWFPDKKAEYIVKTDVEEDRFDLPNRITLEQNYPNPFNPATNITYALPATQRVSLKVYDVLGREVATLINNEVVAAGSYTISFNASSLASGVYIYRLVGENMTVTRKMTLIK